MEDLLAVGVAACLPTSKDLSGSHLPRCMIHATDKKEDLSETESAIRLIRDASADLVSSLSASERILARSIRSRLGVSE